MWRQFFSSVCGKFHILGGRRPRSNKSNCIEFSNEYDVSDSFFGELVYFSQCSDSVKNITLEKTIHASIISLWLPSNGGWGAGEVGVQGRLGRRGRIFQALFGKIIKNNTFSSEEEMNSLLTKKRCCLDQIVG